MIINIITTWRNYITQIVSGSISFNLPPYTAYTAYTERKKNHLNIAHCFCRWQEWNPGRGLSKGVHYPLLHCLSSHSTDLDWTKSKDVKFKMLLLSLTDINNSLLTF